MEASGTQEEFDFLASGPTSTSGRSDAELLKGALMNERVAPEVLQFETDLISRIEQNIDYQVRLGGGAGAAVTMPGSRRQPPPPAAPRPQPRCMPPPPVQEEQIDLLKESDDSKLLVEIYMSELARVRYLLRAYLRTRLQKIERHVMHVLDNAGGPLCSESYVVARIDSALRKCMTGPTLQLACHAPLLLQRCHA